MRAYILYLDVLISLAAAAPEHRGKYARMPRKQICRPTENSPSLSLSLNSSLLSKPPCVHATLAVCLASATATAAPGSSSSSKGASICDVRKILEILDPPPSSSAFLVVFVRKIGRFLDPLPRCGRT